MISFRRLAWKKIKGPDNPTCVALVLGRQGCKKKKEKEVVCEMSQVSGSGVR